VKPSIIALALLLGTTGAQAGPLADALQRHGDRDVDTLRTQRGEVGPRCTLGAVYAKRNDLSRAALYLTDCDDATLPDEVATEIARIHRDVKKQLRASDLAVLEVMTYPEGMLGEIDALPGETFLTPATLYVKPGEHTVHATKDGAVVKNGVITHKRSHAVVILEARARTRTTAPTTGKADFRDDLGGETQQSGPPPNVKHKNILPDKYLRGMTVVGTAEPTNPDAIEDPLATHESYRASRDYWLGIRVGGGMFDDGATVARAGMSFAGAARFDLPALADTTFLAARIDWSRRGGDAPSVDVIGASAGVGMTVLDHETLAVAVLAQLRGDLRLADTRMTTPVSRIGVTAAAGLELALPRTPFTAGLRFEQGLTTLVPGARDRAVLVELGVDWR